MPASAPSSPAPRPQGRGRTKPAPREHRMYYVYTDVGRFETVATSEKRAIANIRFRLFGHGCGHSTIYWRAVAA